MTDTRDVDARRAELQALSREFEEQFEARRLERARAILREAGSSHCYPSWWPQNPYPEDIFPMTVDDYVKAVPDENERTALSGCLGRLFWDMASKSIHEAWMLEQAEDG